MADEGDSKSLVLITRVGSTPTTGTRKARGLQAPGFLLLFGRENKAGAAGARLRPKFPVPILESHTAPAGGNQTSFVQV